MEISSGGRRPSSLPLTSLASNALIRSAFRSAHSRRLFSVCSTRLVMPHCKRCVLPDVEAIVGRPLPVRPTTASPDDALWTTLTSMAQCIGLQLFLSSSNYHAVSEAGVTRPDESATVYSVRQREAAIRVRVRK